VYNNRPPLDESYQLNVPEVEEAAESKAVVLPHVLPSVTLIEGTAEIVATTAALLVVHVPLSNST
jgi:hypothetical protein